MSSKSGDVPTLIITGAHPKLYNHDLAPTAREGRTWGIFSLFAMWMSDVHSVGGYTFAASLFFLGLTGWQVLISMTVGITAVYFLMNLIGRPSQRYGIPFPVMARVSFGVMGANLAATVRGVVGIVWYGVQTYFASKAVQVLIVTLVPSAADLTHNSIIGLSTLAWFSFLFMWLFQLVIFLSGMERIRRFIDFCGPVVYVVMFALAIWMLWQTGFSSLSLQLSSPPASNAATIGVMANAAMLIVAYFSALLLNFGDFARFAKDEDAMRMGNLLGLPVNFLVFSIITVIVTAGTLKVFGEAIMDPVLIVEKIGSPIIVIVGSITFIVATMGINIVANFVSPAYDISNLNPERIDFRMGGLITSILSVLVCPWLFVASPSAITLFVSIFGSTLGPMFGIMIADYYLVKKQIVTVEDLYTMSSTGAFNYEGGWNHRALIALGLSGTLSIGLSLLGAYGLIFNVGDWGWLIGASVGGLIYRALSKEKRPVSVIVGAGE
ncbi:NCS1 family nucleobase:cation symporter-1 [Bradyrhizobium frederickii]|uniref:NCS1 family nucleobase:cation symporter-1 n=1 Tax=Bradyrhizobium frederickii TaxID=2560054 RepID=A0A4Y9P8V0_9BRAD|nr:NCS1 family nucleobase:cation symporter-1 [Bradyrhizobium frederickii]TFV75922.1 NCS1 family nucleobase:cation symporter-1 [Bradyrhizobium frederickii]